VLDLPRLLHLAAVVLAALGLYALALFVFLTFRGTDRVLLSVCLLWMSVYATRIAIDEAKEY
jgi:hypothetical protein